MLKSLSQAAAQGLIGALQGEGGFGHGSQTWDMTAKIAASSSWPPPLAGASGLSWGEGAWGCAEK